MYNKVSLFFFFYTVSQSFKSRSRLGNQGLYQRVESGDTYRHAISNFSAEAL